MLHLLRHVDLEHGQHVEDGILHADAQSQTCLLHSGVCTLNAAAAVEAVEGAGQINDKAVDAAGVVLLGRHDDLLREGCQHPDQIHLGRLGEQGGIHLLGTGKLHALALHLFQDGADAGMGILHIVHRVIVVLMQMVNLMRDGQPVRMSKRTGNAITLTDLLEEVPIDSARFLFNMHDAGSGIDFDLDQAVKTDNDNPVYYVQYAHARICSILKKMESEGVQFAGAEHIDATLLTEPSEMDLIRMLAAFPQEIVMAAEKYDPSRINRFVIDLASAFHRFYGNCRIQGADPAVQQARLALCIGVKNAIFNVLTMFKINVPEKM